MLQNELPSHEDNIKMIALHNTMKTYCGVYDVTVVYHNELAIVGRSIQHHIYSIHSDSGNVCMEFFNTKGLIEIYNDQKMLIQLATSCDSTLMISLNDVTVKSCDSEFWFFVNGGRYSAKDVIKNLFDYVGYNHKNLSKINEGRCIIKECKSKLCSILRKTSEGEL